MRRPVVPIFWVGNRPSATLGPATRCRVPHRRIGGVLVLTRKVGETIRIGQDVYVTVVKIGTSGIRIGIEAPGNSTIVRGELHSPPEPPPLEIVVQAQDDEA